MESKKTRKNSPLYLIEYYGLLITLVIILCECQSNPYKEFCNCGLSFKEDKLTIIKNEYHEGWHGDIFIISAFKYKYLNKKYINILNKNFTPRSKLYIPSTSELDSIIGYDERQLCLIRDSSENVFQVCIIDTVKKIIIAYQITQ